MPRLVTKFKYMKPGSKGRSMGGYARYIATREGVEKLDDSKRHAPVTKKQEALIEKLLRDFPEAKQSHEYADFQQEQTVGNATEFISRTLEENMEAVAGSKTYADYIATRPRAERFGSHGLFTDDGVQVQLSQVSQELNEYTGHVYTSILSLRREDAARLGFDNGSRWRDFLRSQTQTLSENLKIPMEHLRWFAAYHDEGYHPHVHMIVYSSVPGEGYLTKQGIDKMRSAFARDIFQQDLLHTYERQTQYRDELRQQGQTSISEIVAQINARTCADLQMTRLLVELSDRLSGVSGKKIYGYLKADVKAMVDKIVAELAADEQIQTLYDLWYRQREDVLRTYTDHLPERVPLEQNEVFKPIRNAVIQEAMKIVTPIQQAASMEPKRDVPELGLPQGEEPSMDMLEDPAWWMERFHPRFAEESDDIPVVVEPPSPQGTDGREWWSEMYKMGRKYLHGTKEQKPDYAKALTILLIEARRGNGYACYDIGRMYLLGLGCEADEEEAQRWFRDALDAFYEAEQAAEKPGYLWYRIGKCHAYGHGTPQNHRDSALWFQQAVEENSPFAAYALAGQYLRGEGIEQSDSEAYRLYLQAATHEKQPNAYAMYQLGRMCQEGIGTEIDPEASRQWYAKAYQGFLAMEENMADDRLYYRLGSMNLTGTGTEVNLEQAKYYFEKAAELGNLHSIYALGKMHLKEDFSAYDPAEAKAFFEEAAAKGHAYAKYQLGKLLCQGEHTEKDIARGLPLLEELAEAGVSFAAYAAGKVYLREEGWRDTPKAIRWFEKAAEDGSSYAEYQLGKIYYFGSGVRRDRERGLVYLEQSAAHGNEYAQNLLQTIQHQHTWTAAQCAASLFAHLGRIFQDQNHYQEQKQIQQKPAMDRKHSREIEEKKQAMGLRD